MAVSDWLITVDRDCLKFIYHDLQHAEKFFDSGMYLQQIGFFHSLGRLVPESCATNINGDAGFKILNQYLLRDSQFKADLDHVMSDMNTSAVHSIGFLKAKLLVSYYKYKHPEDPTLQSKLTVDEKKEFEDSVMSVFTESWKFNESVTESIKRLTTDKTSEEDALVINRCFHDVGHDVLGLDIPFIQDVQIKIKRIT